MKKTFIQPIVDVDTFEIEDVITTSIETGENEGDIDVGGGEPLVEVEEGGCGGVRKLAFDRKI